MTHEIILTATYPSGAEEWFCSTCGYRFVMKWPPNFKRIILDAGYVDASHGGGKGGLRLGRASVDGAAPPDEGDLSVWLNALG